MVSPSAAVLETVQDFIASVRDQRRSRALTPIDLGVGPEVPWPDYLWQDVRWALSLSFGQPEGVFDELMRGNPAEGIELWSGQLRLKPDISYGYRCLVLQPTA